MGILNLKDLFQMSAEQQVSAFKQLYTEVLKNGGNVAKLPPAIAKKNIKCFVKESGRYFLVTDAWFYIPCYFTPKAVTDFKAKNSNVNISDLQQNVILITDWTLEMAKVKSEAVFTSYGGIEIKLIVKAFQPVVKEKVELKRYPVNLARDWQEGRTRSWCRQLRHRRIIHCLVFQGRKDSNCCHFCHPQAREGKLPQEG